MIKKLKINEFLLVEQFLENNFSSPTHWPDWNLIVSKHYKTHFFYFAFFENNELIGICPVHKTNNGIVSNYNSGQFNYIPNGGWIFSKQKSFNIDELLVPGIGFFTSFTLPAIKDFNVNYQGTYDKKALTLIVDLNQSLDEIWTNCIHSKRRNMIRKAEKSGVEIEIDSKKNLIEFHKYYEQANQNYGLKSSNLEFFRDLFDSAKNIKFDILWAMKDNLPLSGIVIVYDKNYSFYWLGFSNNNSQNLGQGDLLQWEAIKMMKEFGCSYYDLCFIEKERLPHIYNFKSGFSKTEVPIDILIKKTILFKIFNKAKKIVGR